MVDAHRASSLDVDKVQSSVRSSTDCRDEVNKDVEEQETTDNFDCDHIDVDTVDDSPPPSAASAAAAVEGLSTSSLGITCISDMV